MLGQWRIKLTATENTTASNTGPLHQRHQLETDTAPVQPALVECIVEETPVPTAVQSKGTQDLTSLVGSLRVYDSTIYSQAIYIQTLDQRKLYLL